MADLLEGFRADHPQARIETQILSAHESLVALAGARLAAVFGWGSASVPPEMPWQVIDEVPHVAVLRRPIDAPATHANLNAALSEDGLFLFERRLDPHLHDALSAMARHEAGGDVAVNPVATADSSHGAALEAVAAHGGAAIVPSGLVAQLGIPDALAPVELTRVGTVTLTLAVDAQTRGPGLDLWRHAWAARGGRSTDQIAIGERQANRLEIRHLRYFEAVAEELHFGRAAERLYMAQSPLSRQIRQLEAELGVLLFVRRSRGIEIADAGRRLLPRARKILAQVDQALAAVEAARTTLDRDA